MSKDLFMFSYLSCGINLTDILHIRYCDIFGDRLSFHRQKTGKLITFRLQPEAMQILHKYRKERYHPEDYIFPILKRTVHITPQQQYGRVQRVNKRVNRYLKMIGEYLHFPIPLTTYVARHSSDTFVKLFCNTLLFKYLSNTIMSVGNDNGKEKASDYAANYILSNNLCC